MFNEMFVRYCPCMLACSIQAELREQLNKCLMSQSSLCSVGPGGAQMLNPNSEEFAQLMMSITRAQAVSVANRSGTNMFLAPPAASPKPASVIDERGYIVAPPEPLFGVNEVVYASPASLASPASTAAPAFAAAPAYGAAPAAAAAVVAAPRVVTLGQCQKTGWSEKLGGKKKNSWQRRWLELDVGTDETRRAGAPRSSLVLYYKASPMDKKPKGFIVLADCAVSTDVPDEGLFGREYVIGLTPTMGPKDDKAYKLAFTDRRERDSWLTAIENAVLYNRNLS